METDEGYDPRVWAQLNDQLGAAGLAVPEEYGGSARPSVNSPLCWKKQAAACSALRCCHR